LNASDLHEIILSSAPSITIDGKLYYIVENDRKVLDTQVAKYAESVVAASSTTTQGPQKSSELVSATEDDRKMRWKAPTVLTWAMDRASFNGNEERLANALHFCTRATEDWNQAALDRNIFDKIRFEPAAEGREPAFRFAFHPFSDQPGLLALAFFPNAPKEDRVVYIGPGALDAFVGYDQVGIIRHELGHVLGFRHEHIRKESTKGMTAEEMALVEQWVTGGIGGDALTKFDGQSVMHYPVDPAHGLGTYDFELSDTDKEGFGALYSAPYDPATIREFTI
jgi:hypothetical protein